MATAKTAPPCNAKPPLQNLRTSTRLYLKLVIEVHAVEKPCPEKGRDEKEEEQGIDLLRLLPGPSHLQGEDDDGRQTTEEEHEVAGVYVGAICKTNEDRLHSPLSAGSSSGSGVSPPGNVVSSRLLLLSTLTLHEGEEVKAEHDQEEKKVEVGVEIQSYGLPLGLCVTSDRVRSTLRNENSTCAHYSRAFRKKHPPACEPFVEG